MLKFLTAFFFFSVNVCSLAQLQSPEQFLGYQLGDRFTRHHRMVEYFKHVDEAMPNVKVQQYGQTYELRPLIYAIVASAENFANIEQIRQDNLKRAGLLDGTPSTKVAIVWLSYNVHGNEANSMEASMKTIYELVNPNNAKSKEWLKNTVVIFDPCINPDGRDRYANFYNQYGNFPPNPDPQSREHREPWPGGRSNHYLFDLNRDWAWETQTESQARIKIYNEWYPHVHVDFHEQGFNNPYYFAPAAEPFHEVISNWQREFQTMIGKSNAKYFDEQGWLYFTKERFDLYYPSYGDTYPTYSGAIGMTFEQGGHSMGGLTVTTQEGDPLTLRDRLTHHYTTGISTIETSSVNAGRLVDEFEKYFKETNNNPPYAYKTYVIKADNNADKLKKLTGWLDTHGVKYGHASAGKATRGWDFSTQAVNNFNLSTDDIVVNIYQPKGRFLTTVFEPQSKLTDSLTYDVTAWNLMYGYGLKGFALNEKIAVGKAYEAKAAAAESISGKPYAYLFKYQSLNDVAFLGALMQKNVKVRVSKNAFSVAGQNFDAGSLVVTRRNNEGIDFDNIVQTLAKEHSRKVYTTSTGFMDRGNDFGSSEVGYLKAPKVALLGGDQTSSLGHGEVWHFFEQTLHYPLNVIGTDYFKSADLTKYNVLVVPDGYYRLFDESTLESLNKWVSDGGRLILLANANSAFAEKKGFGLKEFANDDAKKADEKADKEQKEKEGPLKYGEAERKSLSDAIFGAIYKVTLDKTHPLAYGLGDYYYSLRTNELHYSYLENGWNVGILKGKQKPLIGFAGYKINKKLENTMVFGVEDKGRGNIVYMVDNPMFRTFWENGKMIFSNAVFMVGQ
jgi:hypothetical protein